MAKKKTTKANTSMKFSKQTLGITVIAVLIASGLLILKIKQSENKTLVNNNQVETTQTSGYPVDSENDGVYTNYEHKFKFEYPENIFITQENSVYYDESSRRSISWTSSGQYSVRDEASIDLNLRWVQENDRDWKRKVEEFEKLRKLKAGAKTVISGGGYTILYSQERDEIKKVAFYSEPINPEQSIEYNYVLLEQKNEGPLISLSLTARKKNTLIENKNIFDSIVSSVEFFEN